MAPKKVQKNDKRRKGKKVTKALTKKQVVSYINLLKKLSYSQLSQSVTEKCLEDHHILTSEIRSNITKKLSSEIIVKKLFDKYCLLYEKFHKGPFKDRYALFQIHWNRSVSEFLDKSSESGKIITEILGNNYEMNDISAVMHSIAKTMFGLLSMEIQKLKKDTTKPRSPDVQEKDDPMSLLAFCGACIRKIYIKSKKHKNQEYLELIKVIMMSKKQRLDFITYGIITSPITKLCFIPKMALLPYIKHLNDSIKESCTETSFALYGKQLVEVRDQPNMTWR